MGEPNNEGDNEPNNEENEEVFSIESSIDSEIFSSDDEQLNNENNLVNHQKILEEVKDFHKQKQKFHEQKQKFHEQKQNFHKQKNEKTAKENIISTGSKSNNPKSLTPKTVVDIKVLNEADNILNDIVNKGENIIFRHSRWPENEKRINPIGYEDPENIDEYEIKEYNTNQDESKLYTNNNDCIETDIK